MSIDHLINAKRARGNILISVLWVIVIMVILVFGLSYEARSDMERTRLYRDRAKAYWLARAAVERVKYDYTLSQMSRLQNVESEFEQTTRYHYDFTEGYAECKLKSSGSLMSVNSKNRDLWKHLVTYYGVDEFKADEVVDAILDWTDPDDLTTGEGGAEADYYQTLQPPYQPPNGAMFSIEELLLIKGITEDMYYGMTVDGQPRPGLRELVSTAPNRQDRFDINTCPTAILMAFLEITQEEAVAFERTREEKMFTNVQEAAQHLTLEDPSTLNRFFTINRGSQFTIVSTGFVYDSPARYTVESEVQYTGNGKLFRNLSHKDFSLKHVDKVPMDEFDEGME